MVFRDFGAKAVSSLFSFEGIYIYIYVKPTRIGIALGQHGRDGTLSERNCLGNVFVTVRDCTA